MNNRLLFPASGLATLIFCLAGAARVAADAPDLVFESTPATGAADIKEAFTPILQYLSEAIGRRVVLRQAVSYVDVGNQMSAGEVDIGSFSPIAYVQAARSGRIQIIAQSLIASRTSQGVKSSSSYEGLIIVRKDSGIQNLAQLAGKPFEFVDESSASGHVYPLALVKENGFDPGKFFPSPPMYAKDHSHITVIKDVLAGKVVGGAIYDDAIALAASQGIDTGLLATIAKTNPIPHDAIAVRTGLDGTLKWKIQVALITFENTDEGRRIIAASKNGLTGFRIVQDNFYDSVRDVAKDAGQW